MEKGKKKRQQNGSFLQLLPILRQLLLPVIIDLKLGEIEIILTEVMLLAKARAN